MWNLQDRETLIFKISGSSEKGVSSEVIEELKFHKMDDDPHSRAVSIIKSYENFLNRSGIGAIEIYFLTMLIMDNNNVLDAFYNCVKEEDLLSLYEFLENRMETDDDEDDEDDEEKNKNETSSMTELVQKMRDKKGLPPMQTKKEAMSFSFFQEELKKESFVKYLYQVYLDDLE